nr:GMC family oxidoreductase [Microlunatus panaciterrae]
MLRALLDTIVPEDDYPSALQSGGLRFLYGVLTGDRPEWLDRVRRALAVVSAATGSRGEVTFDRLDIDQRLAVLDTLSDDPDYRWFALLVTDGFYADPANGGNDDAASWDMIGWTPDPAGGWPSSSAPIDRSGWVSRDGLLPHYDAIVIGSGAGGGVAACVLAESGRRVLVVERGDFPTADFLARDHLRNARTDVGFDHRTAPSTRGNPRTLQLGGSAVELVPTDGRWSNNAMTVGGGTRIYGAQAWRFAPEDFQMASTYGVPEGSALVDWPISYADLEPYYGRAEREIGVSGSVIGDTSGAWRSTDYPMPPLPITRPGQLLADAAKRLEISTLAVPLLINSKPYGGRNACVQCAQCVGFACPVEAKNGAHNTVLARALATGRTSLLLGTRAERVTTDARGRVSGVTLVGDIGGSQWRAQVDADEVIISAGAIETARLLLNSPSDQEPDGLGNNQDQVGRHLQGHVYAGALGIFPDPVNDHVGPGAAVATNDFRHHNPGIIGGGMLANEFVPTPVGYHSYLFGAGLLTLHGFEAKRGMRHLVPRMQRVVGPIQELTSAEARVRLDRGVRDSFGIPVVRLSGSHHPEDNRTQAFLSERAADWLTAAGAHRVIKAPARPLGVGPSGGQHQAGTCRMGIDPKTSVTDPHGRVWGHDNLRVVDGSLNVTNGGVNPVLTIFANAFRVMDLMLAE